MYVGYALNATTALFDAVVVFGGYNGEGHAAAYFSDVWVLYRFATPAHLPCARPGTDGYTCMAGGDGGGALSAALRQMHLAPVPVGFRLVGGRVATAGDVDGSNQAATHPRTASAPRAAPVVPPPPVMPPRRTTLFGIPLAMLEAGAGSAVEQGGEEEEAAYGGVTQLDLTFDLASVVPQQLVHHVRDPLHYWWQWQWRAVTPQGSGWRGLTAAAVTAAYQRVVAAAADTDLPKSTPPPPLPLPPPPPVPGNAPSPRSEHATATVAGELMVVTGGKGPEAAVAWVALHAQAGSGGKRPRVAAPTSVFGDVYALHVPTLTWLPVVLAAAPADTGGARWPAAPPRSGGVGWDAAALGMPPRAGHTATAVASRVYTFGGYTSAAALLGDVWVLDTQCVPGERARSLPAYHAETRPPPSPADYNVPLPVTRTLPVCIDAGASSAAAGPVPVPLPRTALPPGAAPPTLLFTLRQLSVAGSRPLPRFGHTALLLGASLVVLGGYAAGTPDGSWRERAALSGLRMDEAVLSLPLPVVTSISPPVIPRSGRVERAALGAVAGGRAFVGRATDLYVPVRVTVKGRGFGTCSRWVLVDGAPMCAATCTAGRCTPGDLASWVGNNDAAIAAVAVGGVPCVDVLWFSPFALSCSLAPASGGGRSVDEAAGVVVTLTDGAASSDTATGGGNLAGGTSLAAVAGSRRNDAVPLFRVPPPSIHAVSPRLLVDAPARGPLVRVGRHFGGQSEWVPPDILAQAAPPAAGGGDNDADIFDVLPNGGVLYKDGSVAFEPTPDTLATAVYSTASGTDGSNATASELPLVMWVGRRPCLHAVWYSNDVLTADM